MNDTTTGSVKLQLRLEGLAITAVSAVLYARLGFGWGTFAALFLVPDVSFAGYLFGPRIGAACYNFMHGMIAPALLALIPGMLPYALIWFAHIGFDRALGYGLKYPDAFGHTHLGMVGKAAVNARSA
ncbi:MAG: DUF4260 domain-containing protein [Myxococcaceae bacterium]|nr:DUF4260 domain-containing protein [Myxococcaceae bacterium]